MPSLLTHKRNHALKNGTNIIRNSTAQKMRWMFYVALFSQKGQLARK